MVLHSLGMLARTRVALARHSWRWPGTARGQCSHRSWQLAASGLAAAGLAGGFSYVKQPAKSLACEANTGPSEWPLDTPLDVRLGLTKAADVNFRLRWGILGTGTISADWCLSLKDVPGAEVAAVAARSQEKASKFAAEHGIAKVHKTYEDLANDPQVDIIYVGTITPLHKEHTLLAIEAGKHVLCEKILAESAADGREMYAAAEAKGVMLQEGVWSRFFPAAEHARRVLEKGTIGDIVMVQADFPEYIYVLQAGLFGFGPEKPTMVAATASGAAASGLLVQYGDRGCAVLSLPLYNSEFPETVEIIGTLGRITLGPWGHHPTEITVRTTPPQLLEMHGPNGHTACAQNATQPKMEQFEYPIPHPAGIPAPGWHFSNQRGFLYQAEAIHRCLAAGLRVCPQYTKEESLQVLEIVDRALEQLGQR